MPEALSGLVPLEGRRPQRGSWMPGGGPSAQSWGREDPRTDCSGLCHPSPLGPRDRWCMGGGQEDTEFPGRTQGSQRNHREGRAHWGASRQVVSGPAAFTV